MSGIKKLRIFVQKKFENHSVTGNILYGILTGFTGSACVILLILGGLSASGLYSRLDINYKTWRFFIIIAVVLAILVFIYGAMAYFPYRRGGNDIFRKEYTNGTSYKALSGHLKKRKNK